jgi:hypothetical protein
MTADHARRRSGAGALGAVATPAPVVSYLVERTLGPWLAGRTPAAALDLCLLDPACGTGAFLLGAAHYLLAWLQAVYLKEGPERYATGLERTADGGWQLTPEARAGLLGQCLYGVDIDPHAVTSARAALLELLPQGAARQDLSLALAAHIVAGDALSGPDGAKAGLAPFDWQASFPRAIAQGGFDIVLANPPYLSYSGRQAVEQTAAARRYLARRFAAGGWPTAHARFIELALRLARHTVGLIVPAQVGHLEGYAATRGLVSRAATLREVRYWGEDVFPGVITPALTFIAGLPAPAAPTETVVQVESGPERRAHFPDGRPWRISGAAGLLQKLAAQSESLGKLVADPGVHTGNCSRQLILPAGAAAPGAVPVLEGRQVSANGCAAPTRVLRLDYAPQPGEYFAIRPAERYAAAHFLIRQTAAYPIVGPRRGATYFRNSLLALYDPADGRSALYLVALLNSRLLRFAYRELVAESAQRAFPQVKVGSLRRLPIRRLDLSLPVDRAVHDRLVRLAGARLELGERLAAAPPNEQTGLLQAARNLEREIDVCVYELYGLTEAERHEVERDA